MACASSQDRAALFSVCISAVETVMHAQRRVGCADWLELELSMGQLKALMALVAKGPQSVGTVARVLDVAEPSASTLVDRLAAQGLVTREADPADRRRILVTPTAKASDLADRLQQVHNERFTELLSHLSDDDLAAFAQGLRGLAQAAEGMPADTLAATAVHS